MATMRIPITKGKGFVEVNTDDPSQGGDLPAAVYAEALAQGLKVILNRGMSKITVAGLSGDQLEAAKAAAMAKAQENLENIRQGKVRIMAAKADKVSGALMTEARRLARNLIKDEMKRKGVKVSYVPAKEITLAANTLIGENPEILEQAKANLAAREHVVEAGLKGLDVTKIPQSQKLIDAAEAKKKDKPLSAAKAGQTVKRQKPAAQASA